MQTEIEPLDFTERASALATAAGSTHHEDLWQNAVERVDKLRVGGWVTPNLQRYLRIGYNRAAKIAETMEELGWLQDQRKTENWPTE